MVYPGWETSVGLGAGTGVALAVVRLIGQLAPLLIGAIRDRVSAQQQRVSALEQQVRDYQTLIGNHLSAVVPLAQTTAAGVETLKDDMTRAHAKLDAAADAHDGMRDTLNIIEDRTGRPRP